MSQILDFHSWFDKYQSGNVKDNQITPFDSQNIKQKLVDRFSAEPEFYRVDIVKVFDNGYRANVLFKKNGGVVRPFSYFVKVDGTSVGFNPTLK